MSNSNETDTYSLELKSKALTIPEILDQLPNRQNGQPHRLLCFGNGKADHFFRMANSASTLVVDASEYYEMELLEKIAKRRLTEIRLVRVDLEDAEELFRHVADGDSKVTLLARAMSAYVDLKHTRLDVSAREFEPSSLPAILRDGEGAEERERALRIYHDPRQSRDARELAGAIIKQPAKSMKLTINAANSFIKRLAEMQKPSDPNV
jgi:hypothetical protein